MPRHEAEKILTMSGASIVPEMDIIKSKNTKKIFAIRAILFSLIFVALFACLSYFFQPVFTRETNYLSKRYFYNEPENTIETVFLGASIVYHGITPMELYENYGLCTYDLGTSNQPVLASYYWLEEAYRLHEETLKTAVFDVSILRKQKGTSWYRLATDAMNYSTIKWRAVSDYTDSFEETLNYFIPLLSYHDRWTEFTKTDFAKVTYDDRGYLRGYYFNPSNKYFTDNSYADLAIPDYYPDYGTDEMELNTESLYYLKRMIDFCQEHDIKLVLIKTPGQDLGISGHNAVQTIADNYGLDFLDFNYAPLIDEIDYNHAIDSSDGSHLNYYGASKLTAWLGNYLVEECGATDVRGMEKYAFLEDELAEYHSQVTNIVALKDAMDPAEYLKIAASNEDYAIFVAVKNEASESLTNEQRKAFDSLGLNALSKLGFRDSYLAVIDGGRVLCEKTKKDPGEDDKKEAAVGNLNNLEDLTMNDVRESRVKKPTEDLTISYKGMLSDGTPYALVSGGYSLGRKASVKLDGVEWAYDTRGLNIVVYDKVRKEVIDYAIFDTYESSTRDGNDLERALAAALKNSDDYTVLSQDLQKLYLYNLRCESAREMSYLKQLAGKDGLVTYLDGVMSNEDYAVFLSVKTDASMWLGSEVRAAIQERGFEELSELEYGDSYLAMLSGGMLLFEERTHDEEPLSVSDAWISDKDNSVGVLYSIISAGCESGNMSSIIIDGTDYSENIQGINIIVWNTITNTLVDSVVFGTAGE